MVHFPNPRDIGREVGQNHVKTPARPIFDFFHDLRLPDIANNCHHITVSERRDWLFVDAENKTCCAHRLAGGL
jgi:hypothetical protein